MHSNNNNNNNNNNQNKRRSFIRNGQFQQQNNNSQQIICDDSNISNIANTNTTTTKIIITDGDIPTKCAYCTMVINSWEYLSGAFTLAWSIKTSGSKASRVIMIDKEINKNYGELIKLTGLFDDVFVIPNKLNYTAIQKKWRKYAESGIYDWINTSFNKYYCFTLTRYSRVIMLDADQICLKNPDELFKLSCPAGICSFYSELNNTLQNRHHGQKVPNADIRRSYERQWGIRGCLFMIEPSTNTWNDIYHQLEYQQQHNGGIGDHKCFLGADEKFLTKYYMTTNGDLEDSDWTHIHTKYSRLSYIDKTALAEDPYFLHFCTFKPWKSPGNDKWIHEQWEDIAIWVFAATSMSLSVSNQLMPPQQEATPQQQSCASQLATIMSPDAQFFMQVLQQEWAQEYIQFGSSQQGKQTRPEDILLTLYHMMANSYKQSQLKKQNRTKDLKKKIQATMSLNGNEQDIVPKIINKIVDEQKQQNLKQQHQLSGSISMQSIQSQQQTMLDLAMLNHNNNNRSHHNNRNHHNKRHHHQKHHHHHNNNNHHKGGGKYWSFDYNKKPLLAALIATAKHDKIPDKIIWQFWDKAEHLMTPNIKFCIDSVRKNNPDWRHILVTPHNIWTYLNENELPSNLFKFDMPCHISDVVRVALLAKYGGIYCDSTIICFKNCRYMNFNFFWDKWLMEQGYDFVGFRYDNQKTKWKNDEKFCCWFMATKKDNGLFYSWLNKINILMKNKTSNSQLDIIDSLYSKNNSFKKYVALGPGILDELFDEYCHYHPNFKYQLIDPRDFALLDQFFNYEQLWYLNGNDEYNFKEWFEKSSPHFIKLFCAAKGTKQLYKILKEKLNYTHDNQIKLQDILNAKLILSDIFQFV